MIKVAGGILLLFLAYLAIAFALPIDPVREVTYLTATVVMVVVLVSWAITVFSRLTRPVTGPRLLNLSITLAALIFLESRIVALINYYWDRPDWLYYSVIPGFIAF